MRRLASASPRGHRELVLVEPDHVAVVEEADLAVVDEADPHVGGAEQERRDRRRRRDLVEPGRLAAASARSTSVSSSEDCSCIRTVT